MLALGLALPDGWIHVDSESVISCVGPIGSPTRAMVAQIKFIYDRGMRQHPPGSLLISASLPRETLILVPGPVNACAHCGEYA